MGEIESNSIDSFLDQRRVPKDSAYRQVIYDRVVALKQLAAVELNARREYWDSERKKWRNLDDDSIANRRDAEAWLEAIRYVVAHPESASKATIGIPESGRNGIDEPSSNYLLSTFRNDCIDHIKANMAPKTVETYERVMKAFIAFIGEKSITDLTLLDLEKYKQSRKGKVSDSTINMDARTLKAALQIAVTWGKIETNPFQLAKNIRVPQKEKSHLTSEEVINLLGVIKEEWYKKLVQFALLTGLRRGELLNLRRSDYDIKSGVILVQSSDTYRVKGGKFRRIALNDEAIAILSSLSGTSEWLFVDGRGEKIRDDLATKKFKKYAIDAKLSEDLHFHSLRHTFATIASNGGVTTPNLKVTMGHSSVRTTEGYIGSDIDTMREQMKKVSLKGYISGATESKNSE